MLLLGDESRRVRAAAATDPEALIEEARRRQRRRRRARLIVIGCAVLGAAAAIVVLARSGGSPRGARSPGAGAPVGLPTGPLATLRVAGPLAVGPTGTLYVADVTAHRVLVRLADGRFRVVAGTGRAGFSGDDGPAIDARLSDVEDLAFAPSGNLYVVDAGRVRVIDRSGVIRTIAGTGKPARGPVKSGTLALQAALGASSRGNPLSIAISPSGQLWIATGLSRVTSQLLRLTGDRLTVVRAVVASGFFKGQVIDEIGRVAVDARGDVYSSGGYGGWVVWQITPRGAAYQVGAGSFMTSRARRSGGDYSVLERSPSGAIYAEDGPGMRRIQGHRYAQTLAVADPVRGETFWLTYFAFAPNGTIYADEIPGGVGFEAHQQLIAINRDHAALLWQERNKTPR
jgi:hypothetical protein